ncbi:putative metallopeptidase [Burkholderia sp. Ac-20384]|uniref:putative metallopeptidase n=1 Tax=Burkholderia sp. Ac-20384 TaxID=2703902 RepID=UPI001F121DF0|nr:putative metallopeptidase [Burkholderia sp. Ac-20384]
MPPSDMLNDLTLTRRIVPAHDMSDWVWQSILREGAPLHNDDHRHLWDADIAYLWASAENTKRMRRVVGQCEEVMIRAGGWQKARQEQQFCEWFGRVPDFLITFDAHYAHECSDLQWCALVEHELYHVGQRVDDFGAPAFTKDGMPKLGIRGHDVEEFVGIVRRYGIAGGSGDTEAFVAAAQRAPEIGRVEIGHACGTCMLRAA